MIKDELKNKNYKILEAINMLRRGDKSPLPFLILTFTNYEDIKEIYRINEIMCMKVEIEPIRSKLSDSTKGNRDALNVLANITRRYVKSNNKSNQNAQIVEGTTLPIIRVARLQKNSKKLEM